VDRAAGKRRGGTAAVRAGYIQASLTPWRAAQTAQTGGRRRRMTRRPVRAFVALGSNLEDPRRQLREAFSALDAISGSRLVARSPVYRSKPIGPADQPDYLNAVVELETRLEAEELLDQLQRIEQQQGRQRSRRWGPRTLDLDLLAFGDQRVDTTRLRVPHPEIPNRAFVLVPLADLASDLELPGLGRVSRLLDALDPSARSSLEVQP
jgi:2-amino-4-hydroxy-6-hydroxymethyldihydropteridine diphosphokinase